jgi:diguanylate cyclase (GGDEF)-like protein/PAS domain S-box-containing protein
MPTLIYLPYLLSAIITFAGVRIAWRQRTRPAALPLAFLSLFAGLWAVFYIFELMSSTLAGKILWASLKFIWIVPLPICLAAFVLRFAGWHHWPNRRWLVGLSIFPLITLAVIFTNNLHHLFWQADWLVFYHNHPLRQVTYGPWFWMNIIYTYSIIAICSVFAFTNLTRLGRVYYRQINVITLAMLLPIAANILSLVGLFPNLLIDLSPLTFGISVILLLLSASLGSLFDVLPLAYVTLLEQMRPGTLIFDATNRVIDLNPAAERVLGLSRKAVVGKKLDEIDHPAMHFLQHLAEHPTIRREIMLGTDEDPHWYEMSASSIAAPQNQVAGRLVIWYDITDRKRIEAELRHASTHDPLTGLYNRLYFEEEFQRVLTQRSWPVAILMADIDNLKAINDHYGHPAGDQTIRAAADLLRQALRRGDLVARMGGDEFMALIPNCDAAAVESLLRRINRLIDEYNQGLPIVPVEMSLGSAIASEPRELEPTRSLADADMYANKTRRKQQAD